MTRVIQIFDPEADCLRYLMIVNGSQNNVTARNWDRLTRSSAVMGDF